MTTMWYVQKKIVFDSKDDCHQAVSTGLERVALASCVDYEPYAKCLQFILVIEEVSRSEQSALEMLQELLL